MARAQHCVRRSGCIILGSIAGVLPAFHALGSIIEFSQIDWRATGGGFTAQNSEWGNARIGLEPADLGFFGPGPNGMGLAGYFNVVTSVSGGGNNWAVQNLPFYVNGVGDLSGMLPTGVHFDLGTARGVDVSSLQFGVMISSTPLGSMPAPGLSPASVGERSRLIGGEIGVGPGGVPFSGSSGQAAPPEAQNFAGAPALSMLGDRGSIGGRDSDIAEVEEDENGCVPGAAARSLRYLGDQFPDFGIEGDAQSLYEELRGLMETEGASYGSDGDGTTPAQWLAAKDAYARAHDLELINRLVLRTEDDPFDTAIDYLNKFQDVEMGVFWGNDDEGMSMGGHSVFVTEIETHVDADGNVVGYTVRYIDDTEQGDGMASNHLGALEFDAMGNMLGHGTGARLNNFKIEAIPSASTLGVLAMGALVACRRRRRVSDR